MAQSPAGSAVKALQLELKKILEEPVEGFRVKLIDDDNLFEWEVAIFGPPGTLYEGGYFKAHNLCSFHNDPFPLGDSYRSYFYKNLVLNKGLWPSYCGLDSTIPFNGTFNGERCEGTVSDWDEDSCTTRGTILLRSHTCASLLAPMEFQCLAFIREEDISLQQLLITRSMDGRNEFNCWVITSFVSGGRWPWRAMYRMPNTQCSLLTDMEVDISVLKPKATLYLEDKSRSKVCKPAERSPVTVPADQLTESTDKRYYLSNNGEAQGEQPEVFVNESPGERVGNEAPNMAGYENAANVCFQSWALILAVAMATRCVR